MQTFGQSQISKGKKGQRQGRDQEHEVQQQQQQQHAGRQHCTVVPKD
jgi:hypothetical protein